MKVILLNDVKKIGKKYEVKNVSDGFALNFLIPNALAEVATAQSEKKLEKLKAVVSAQDKINADLLAKNLKSLEGAKVEMKEKVNEKGHLFAGIHKEAIVKAIKTQIRLDVSEDFIVLEKPIKELGDHAIEVKVNDATAHFTLVVTKA